MDPILITAFNWEHVLHSIFCIGLPAAIVVVVLYVGGKIILEMLRNQ